MNHSTAELMPKLGHDATSDAEASEVKSLDAEIPQGSRDSRIGDQADADRHASVRPEVLVIRPTQGWRAVQLGELWRWRELLFFLAWRDIKVRYKQTVLGMAWAVVQPVMTMVVFTVFFGRLGGMSRHTPSELPFQVFVYASLLPWQFFSFCLTQGGTSLIQNERLISKVYFPRILLPCATIGTALVDFSVSFCVMVGLISYYGIAPTGNILLLPVLVAGLTLVSLGAATTLASLSVAYRDFRHIVPFLVQIWMFMSPVAYPMNVVPPEWRRLYALNPIAGIIDGFSSSLLGLPIHWDTLLISLGVSVAMFLFGFSYFRTAERRFADII